MTSRADPPAADALNAGVIEAALPANAAGLVVAFSGGVDSTVLLHLAAQVERPVRAVHVHHGLHEQADHWAAHCRRTGERLGITVDTRTISIDRRGDGIEAAARADRYRVLGEALQADECLLTAHHADDQLETLLYRLLRGTGPAGLAGIQPAMPLGPGWLIRPLLAVSRAQLEAHARRHGLSWIDDPGNASLDHDRNYLRHRVIPAIEARWPRANAAAVRLATHAREQGRLTDRLLRDRRQCGSTAGDGPLAVTDCASGDDVLDRAMLRAWIRDGGQRPPGARRLAAGQAALVSAAQDRDPVLAWSAFAVRRHRGWLFRLPRPLPAVPTPSQVPPGRAREAWGDLGEVFWSPALAEPLWLRVPHAGERIALSGRRRGSIRELQRERGVPPWWRDRLPALVDEHDRCLAVAGLGTTRIGAERAGDATGIGLDFAPRPLANGPDWQRLFAPAA
ncbi:tRNA lysidine(34) synthetase TilS [Spiribacter vilamensis]|uniref:tRNA(Ile)-lysidine synthase n=1 Tax=Spiribacter vilamensis TaxID=531306 RepID=A0A4Q8CZM1_9GAMM|nr:tRNA lysidine(34) synthetase TilS [Spiribacter vilamensis]RZU98463.1 tRNA(Ile)-lysidine synthase [Spiribacter vilamensis]TVO60664.1 tRNA lysidine(34) synthetase TilS [Spiribacter vilamensis]